MREAIERLPLWDQAGAGRPVHSRRGRHTDAVRIPGSWVSAKERRTSAALWTIVLTVAPWSTPMFAEIFGEGYSSLEPGAPADVRYRAFTVYTLEEECAGHPRPARLTAFPDPVRLSIGDRIHRTNVSPQQSELVIEAYDASERFLPSVPIALDIADGQRTVESRSDWDYLEAVREGKGGLRISWLCPNPDDAAIEAHVRIMVSARSGAGE